MGVKFLSDCYYVAEYIYFYVYGYHFDKREKEGAAKFSWTILIDTNILIQSV